MTMMREREVFLAKLAEQAERYDEMVEHMETVCTIPEQLSVEERNLLSVAYKNAVGGRRAACRTLASMEAKEEAKGSNEEPNHIKEYRKKIEGELQNICEACLTLTETSLLPKATSSESKIFYLKMKSDYHRYLADCLQGEAKAAALEAARLAHDEVSSVVAAELAPIHPMRLGLSLSWAVWNYEVLGLKDEAISLAQTAFDAAIENLDSVSDDSYKDSTLIMQLLQNNLQKWTAEQGRGV